MPHLRRLLLLLVALPLAGPAPAATFHTRESALELAFPGAQRVERREWILTPPETARVKERAGVTMESALVTAYEAYRDGELLGWAFLDTHVVRTSPETILLALGPDGRVLSTHLVAFHEPPEYQASPRWLDQFRGRELDRHLAVGRDIDGIAGSTLTSRAVTAAVRRLLAVWSVKLAGSAPVPEPAS